jgi:hypothetical protein
VLLIIKKRDKVTPISLISPSADCAGTYKIQASNNISLTSIIHLQVGLPHPVHMWSCYQVQDIVHQQRPGEGLPNDGDTSKAALSFTHLLGKFLPNKAAAIATNCENKDMVPVLLILLPVAVPAGSGKPTPIVRLAN